MSEWRSAGALRSKLGIYPRGFLSALRRKKMNPMPPAPPGEHFPPEKAPKGVPPSSTKCNCRLCGREVFLLKSLFEVVVHRNLEGEICPGSRDPHFLESLCPLPVLKPEGASPKGKKGGPPKRKKKTPRGKKLSRNNPAHPI